MEFVYDYNKVKTKFAWLPVCVSEDEDTSIYIWLEPYTESVVKRYGLGGVIYKRTSKNYSGNVSGFFG